MPQVIPLIAAAFNGIATVVSGVAMAATGAVAGGSAALAVGGATFTAVAALGGAGGFGAFVSAWATVAAVASLAVKPKIPQSSAGQISLKLDPQGPIPVALGRTATGGYIIYRAGFGPKNKHLAIISALSTGPIQAIEDFYANDVLCTFTNTSAGPTTTSGQWTGKMRQFRLLGEATDAAYDLPVPPFEAELPGWTSAHKTTGFATSLWINQFDTGRYPTGLPRGLWVVQGEKFYDPRLDSTYPGGSGSHRLATPSTWAYTENPYIMALGWILGRYHNGKKVWGCGVPATGIDWVSYVDGANVADANTWKAGGVITSADDKRAVLDAILQAGSGIALPRGGLISCMVNSPKTSIYTITTTDVVGEVSIQTSQPRRNRVNTITPKYRSEANRWQVVMGGAVSNATYVSEDDGAIRTKEIEYSLCQSVTQVAQLAAYDLVNAREGLLFTVVCKPRLLNVKIGEAVSINLDELGVVAQKGIVLARTFDPASLNVTLTIRSETEAKHAYALGKTTVAPPSPSLTRYDPATIAAPAAGVWTATGTTVTNGTTTLPAIFVSGTTDDPNAASVIIEYRKTGTSAYVLWAEGPASSGSFEITGLAATTAYEVAVSYRSVRGVVGSRLALASTTTGNIVSAGTVSIGTRTATQLLADVDQALADAAAALLASPNGANTYAAAAQASADAAASDKTAAEAAQAAAEAAKVAGQTARDQSQAAYTAADAARGLAVDAKNLAASSATTAANSASAAAGSASTATTKATEAESSATSASGFANTASVGATNASNSAAAAATSASSATASNTAAGDSASAAQTAKVAAETARDTASGSASAAATSASSAAGSSTAAGTSASSAQTSATQAATSASGASTSATQASTSATNAAGSASTASTSATNAADSATQSGAAASAAATSASVATTKATEAGTSATSATSASNTATTKATEAANSATGAATSATGAAASNTAAATSASAASTAQVAAEAARDAASGSASASASSASSAAGSATAAGTSASAASTSATSAATQAANANTSATQASTSATGAAGSASTASTSATNASNSANAAGSSATAAGTSATLASTKATEAGTSATSASTSANTASTQASNAFISANAASTSAASASASAALASSTAIVSATISETGLAKNPIFAAYTNSPGIPDGWTDWGNGSGTRTTGQAGSNAYRVSVGAGGGSGIQQSFYMTKGYYVIEAEVWCESGNVSGAGIYVSGVGSNANLMMGSDADLEGNTGAGGAGVRRWAKLIYYGASESSTFYALTGWSGLGSVTAKTLSWYRASIRPASQAEVNGNQAKTDVATVSATVTTQQAALADLSGKTTARYMVEANANGVIAGIYLVAAQGTAGTPISAFRVKANVFEIVSPDLTSTKVPFVYDAVAGKLVLNEVVARSANIEDLSVTTLKIGNSQVITDKIGTNAVTKNSVARTSASILVGTSWTTIQSVSITTDGGLVRCDLAFSLNAVSTVGSHTMRVRVVRDGSVVVADILACAIPAPQRVYGQPGFPGYYDVSIPVVAMMSNFVIDASPSAGAHTYTIDLQQVPDTAGLGYSAVVSVAERNEAVLEIKR